MDVLVADRRQQPGGPVVLADLGDGSHVVRLLPEDVREVRQVVHVEQRRDVRLAVGVRAAPLLREDEPPVLQLSDEFAVVVVEVLLQDVGARVVVRDDHIDVGKRRTARHDRLRERRRPEARVRGRDRRVVCLVPGDLGRLRQRHHRGAHPEDDHQVGDVTPGAQHRHDPGGEEREPGKQEPRRLLVDVQPVVEEPDYDERRQHTGLGRALGDQQEHSEEHDRAHQRQGERQPQDAQLDIGLVLREQREQREHRKQDGAEQRGRLLRRSSQRLPHLTVISLKSYGSSPSRWLLLSSIS